MEKLEDDRRAGKAPGKTRGKSRYSGPSVVSLRNRIGVITLWTGSFRGAGFLCLRAMGAL